MSEATADGLGTNDTNREVGHRVIMWLLLKGSRLVIAGGIVGGVLVIVLVLLWRFGVGSFAPRGPMYYLFAGLLTGNLTLITVVVTINQLVLAREFGDPGSLKEQLDATRSYRRDVEATAEAATSPKSPPNFLRFLYKHVRTRAQQLAETTATVDEPVRHQLEALTTSLLQDVRTVNRALESDADPIFAVVSATTTTNYPQQLRTIAELQDSYVNVLSDDQLETIERIDAHLAQLDIARKYMKTIYVQQELAYLSRLLLYIGVPTILTCGLALILYNTAITPVISVNLFFMIVAGAFVMGFVPLAILTAFVLRLAWVAQQMATVAPFTSQLSYHP